MMIDEHALHEPAANSTVKEPNIIEAKRITVPKSNAVRSLKQLQNETRAIEVEFFERVYELETEIQNRHESVYRRRSDIVNGDYVPTEAEDLVSDNVVSQSSDEKNTKQQIPGSSADACTRSGVPHFWLKVLTSTLSDIHENDRPILQHLTDVRGKNKPLSDLGFILEFHFSPNDYFDNEVLRKEYFYTSSDNKMIHEIPLIRKSVGCDIKWKDGKAPTYRSWVDDFLASSKIISNSDEEFMSYITGVQKDFEMGYFIKEHVIPKAVLYFTGEEKNLFNICNYTSGYWSSMSSSSSESLTEDKVSSEGEESKSGPKHETENNAQYEGKIATDDECKV